jgi:hypothetical protein
MPIRGTLATNKHLDGPDPTPEPTPPPERPGDPEPEPAPNPHEDEATDNVDALTSGSQQHSP